MNQDEQLNYVEFPACNLHATKDFFQRGIQLVFY